jgi:hypothetical protein
MMPSDLSIEDSLLLLADQAIHRYSVVTLCSFCKGKIPMRDFMFERLYSWIDPTKEDHRARIVCAYCYHYKVGAISKIKHMSKL